MYFEGWKPYRKLKKARAVAYSKVEGGPRNRVIRIEAESTGETVGEVFLDGWSGRVMYRQIMRLDDSPHRLERPMEYLLLEDGSVGGFIRKG